MPIHVACPCGRMLKVPEAMAGKKGRCPACNGVVTVPADDLEIPEVEAVEPAPARVPRVPPPPLSRPDRDDRRVRRRDDEDDDRPRRRRDDDEEDDRGRVRRGEDDDRPPRRREEDDEPRPSRPRLAMDDDRPRRRREREKATGGGGWGMNPSVGGGLLAMLGAVVWFFGGLAFGIIFFYPPILFIIGLVAFIGGLVKGE